MVIIILLAISFPSGADDPGAGETGTAKGIHTLITIGTNESDQQNGAIWGDYLAWEDNSNGNWDIYLYHLLTGNEVRLSSDSADQLNPALYGNIVAWQDHRNGDADIYVLDLSSGTESRITNSPADQVFPAVNGDRVVWIDTRSGTPQVYLYNITTAVEIPVTSDAWEHAYPTITGDYITWVDYRDNNTDICLYQISTGNTTRVTKTPGQYRLPVVDGDFVVWEDDTNSIPEIQLYCISSGNTTSVTAGIPDAMPTDPDLDGGRIVWQDSRGTGYPNIFLYEIASGQTWTVTNESFSNQAPVISGNRIAWTAIPEMYADIALFTINATGPCPVASFTNNLTLGSAPLTVQFHDTSTGAPVYRAWDFGDGSQSTEQDPVHQYIVNGTYSVSLTLGSSICRDKVTKQNLVSIGGVPVARFYATPASGPAPLTVQFTDTSEGSPDDWLWDFGDNSTGSAQHPVHQYDAPGTYNVTLMAGNIFGNSSVTYPGLITIMAGTTHEIPLTMPGIEVFTIGTVQRVMCNTSLANCTFDPANNTFLRVSGPSGSTLEAMILLSGDGRGFTREGNDTIAGNLTGAQIRSSPLYQDGFSAETGMNSSVRFELDLPAYPQPENIVVTSWEGATPQDYVKLLEAVDPNPDFAGITHVAYTTRFDTTNAGSAGAARVVMSVNTTWVRNYSQQYLVPYDIDTNPTGAECSVDGIVAGTTPLTLSLTPGIHLLIFYKSGYGYQHETINVTSDSVRILRIGDDGVVGILNTTLLSSDPVSGLDYYEAYSPDGLSTFALTALNRHGNPFQLFTLFWTTHYSTSGSSSGGGGGGGGSGGGGSSTVSASLVSPSTNTDTLPDATVVETPAYQPAPDSFIPATTGEISGQPPAENVPDAGQSPPETGGVTVASPQKSPFGIISGMIAWVGGFAKGRFIFIFAAVAITVISVVLMWRRGEFGRR